ncbi:arabinofuranosidase catalytic domain-containing protein [Streptomyces sp. NPDC049040]|uniref:arabinofuranosidase catalytic domain-containing protein n=1 Tax=Streptomyces sp. NPDC049040 TaxID=3365593 RepID=UPI00371CD804
MIRTWLRRFRRSVLSGGAAVALAAGVLAGTAAPSHAAGQGPCDIYAAGGTPCVAAHSTVRALYASFGGSLYQVRRSSDNTTRDIGVVAVGGRADAAAQDSFCTGTSCVITTVYDQSGHGNDLKYQGPGGAGGSDTPASATTQSLTVAGGKAYPLYIKPGNSYWRDGHQTGVPTGSAPEGEYMVTSGTHVNSGCCFDYGNSETDRRADGAGAMDAIYFGTSCWFGGCSGSGPWVEADLEYGLYSGGSQSWNSNQKAFTNPYVTAMLKNNGTSRFAIKGANAQSGGLSTLWDGALPPGYSPMKKQGAIILGSGGDCCNGNTNQSQGTFYEGAMTSGYPSDATENAVQANIAAAGYGGSSTGTGGTSGALHAVGANKCLDVPNSSTATGTQLQIWDCSGGANQQFTRTSSGQLTVYSGGSQLCLDASGQGTANGTKVVTWTCNGQSNQQWNVSSDGSVTGAQSGLCLDVTGASSANGALVELWACNGGSNQRWSLS